MFRRCPPKTDLLQLSEGTLPPDESTIVGAHLDTCADCVAVLEELKPADGLCKAISTAKPTVYASEQGYVQFSGFVDSELKALVQLQPDLDSATAKDTAAYTGPRRIGPYRIVREIGRGGMGTVFEAIHTKLGSSVALKLMRNRDWVQPQAIARFTREMKALGRLSHRNVVKATDAGCDDTTTYIAMELIDGLNLSNIIRRLGRLPIADACELIRQVADGLAHLHHRGLIHRDIKPSNLMLTSQGQVKILDLGLARMVELASADDHQNTHSGQMLGTVDYMAPEQGLESSAVDIRADLYSLGATLYKLLTTRVPYDTGDEQSILLKLRKMALSDPRPIRELRPEIPVALAKITHRLLSRELDQRYQHPADVEQALRPFCKGADLVRLHDLAKSAHDAGELPVDSAGEENSDSRRQPATVFASRQRITIQHTLLILLIGIVCLAGLTTLVRKQTAPILPGQLDNSNEFQSPSTATLQATEEFVGYLEGHSDCVFGVKWIDSQRLVSSSWDGTVRIWDAAGGKQLRRMESRGNAAFGSLAVSVKQSLIAACNIGRTVYFWHSPDGEFSHAFQLTHVTDSVCMIDFSPSGNRLLVAGNDGTFEVLDAWSGQAIATFGRPGKISRYAGKFVDEQRIVIGGDHQLRLIDLNSPTDEVHFSPAPQSISAMQVLSTDQVISCSSWSRFVHLWSHETNRVKEIELALGINSLDCFSDQPIAAIGLADKSIRLIDLDKDTEFHRIDLPSFAAQRLSISPDGRHLVSGGGWHVTNQLETDDDFRLAVWKLKLSTNATPPR